VKRTFESGAAVPTASAMPFACARAMKRSNPATVRRCGAYSARWISSFSALQASHSASDRSCRSQSRRISRTWRPAARRKKSASSMLLPRRSKN
jgi:hypothetical protein